MANRYWVGGTGTWDTTTTTNWSTTSNGAGGASAPTSSDDVYLDSFSGTGTITAANNAVCRSLYCTNGTTGSYSGTLTISTANFQYFYVFGDFILSSTMTFNMPWLCYPYICNSAGTWNLDMAGKPFGTYYGLYIGYNGGGSTVNILSPITQNASSVTALFYGDIITNNNSIDLRCDNGNATLYFETMGSGSRLGSSVINVSTGTLYAGNLSGTVWGNSTLVINRVAAATTTIVPSATATNTTGNIGNIRILSDVAITGNITIANCTISGAGSVISPIRSVIFNGNTAGYPTINGYFSTISTAPNRRILISSSSNGLTQAIGVNGTTSLVDVDFRDIYVVGTAAPIRGVRIGDRGGNNRGGESRGIVFSTPKNVYLVYNGTANVSWHNNIWSTTDGGTADLDVFPLPQDTVIVKNNSITAISLNATGAGNCIGTIDMSARTSALTVTISSGQTVFGDWKNGSGITFSTANTLTFAGGYNKVQTITSAGKSFSGGITIDSIGGTVQLADTLSYEINSLLTVSNGNFITNNNNIAGGGVSSTGTNIRSITLGSSTLTLSATVFSLTQTNLTFSAGTSQISMSNPTTIGFSGGGLTFNNVTFTSNGTMTHAISGANTFNNLTFTAPSSGGINGVTFAANQTITGTLTCAGASAVRRIFLRSDTLGTPRTLTVNSISATDCDFRDINLAGTASGASLTRAGNCGGNSGITFPTAKSVYWNLAGTQNWSAVGWAPSSGGTPDINQFPLAQDTAVFDNTGAAGTITIDTAWNIGTFDASIRTSAMTLSTGTSSPLVYGDWKFGTGVTSSSATGTITFSKSGTQIITSNGVQFRCPITVAIHPSGIVQLGDALSLNFLRTLTLGVGTTTQASNTFDAVTYNVTAGSVNCQSGSFNLKMGSGTWTLSGTGSVWNMAAIPVITAGTSTIVLSDTSTTARTFAGGGLYYNKLTIGGTTGTSTLTITGANTFGELASTKTVAHTILFQSSATTAIGKWSVTGSSGNVVTIGPQTAATAYTLSITGPATSGIDYLSISYCTVSTLSPGEFYVGANSTNTAGNTRVVFTAPPSPRTLYWRGGTGNWSSTTSWDTVQNGAGGAAIPTSLDSVIFDSTSSGAAYTVTVDAGVTLARCASFNMSGPASGSVNFTGSTSTAFHGNVTFAATGVTTNYTGNFYLAGNGSYTFTNPLSLASTFLLIGDSSTWTLGGPLTTTGNIVCGYGSFNSGNNDISASSISTSSGIKSSITLGTNTVTLSGVTGVNFGGSSTSTAAANLTFNCGTSTIVCNNSSGNLYGAGKTFYNFTLSLSAVSNTYNVYGINTFNNFTISGTTTLTGVRVIQFFGNQTISGTFTITGGDAVRKTFIRCDTLATTRTLTCAAASLSDGDFRDIIIAGAAAPASGTRLGDCGGNSGITFPAAKTVYWNLAGTQNWSATGWAPSSGGTPAVNNFPLAQDTAIFDNASAAGTVTIDGQWNIGTLDSSTRTSSLTLSGTSAFTIYGDLKYSSSGFTNNVTSTITMGGRNKTIYLKPSVGISNTFIIYAIGSTIELQSNLTVNNNSFTLSAGTLNQNNYAINAPTISCDSSYAKTWNIGSGTVTSTGAGGISLSGGAVLPTITGTGNFILSNSSAKSFTANGISCPNITLTQAGAGALTISGNASLKDITNSYSATGATSIVLGSTITTLQQFTATGTSGKTLTISGTSASSPATLIVTGSTKNTSNYLALSGIKNFVSAGVLYADNSINGGASGWHFQKNVSNSNFFSF